MTLELSKTWNQVFPSLQHEIKPPSVLTDFIQTKPSSQAELDYAKWVFEQPKVELHVHLEAAISASFYAKLNEKEKHFKPEDSPLNKLPFEVFRDFLMAWWGHTLLVKNEAIFHDMVLDFAKIRDSENIVYSEVHISPLDFSFIRERFEKTKGLNVAKCFENYISGAKAAEKLYPNQAIRFIVDAEWPSLPSEREELLAVLKQVVSSDEAKAKNGDCFFVAVGLGGPELVMNIEEAIPFLDSCREIGLKVDVHSGETTTRNEHRSTLQSLKPNRIAHGIAGMKTDLSSDLEDFFFDGHISACPTSNVLTGSWPLPLNEHPVDKLWKSGQSFSINTDDPLLFASCLSLEYVALFNAFGWKEDFFHSTQKFAKEAAFANLL